MRNIIAQKTENAAENRELSRGDRVKVRDYAGRLLDRRVWGVGDRVVYVCTDRLFKALEEKRERTTPIGFPKDDVRVAA